MTHPAFTSDEWQKLQAGPLAVLDLLLDNLELPINRKNRLRDFILDKYIKEKLRDILENVLRQHNINRSNGSDDYGQILADIWLSIKTDLPVVMSQYKTDLRSPREKLVEIGDLLDKSMPEYHAWQYKNQLLDLCRDYRQCIEEQLDHTLSNRLKDIFRDSYSSNYRDSDEKISAGARLAYELAHAALKHKNDEPYWQPLKYTPPVKPVTPPIKPVAPPKAVATPTKPPVPLPSSLPVFNNLPIYLLIDSSRHVSDCSSFFDDGIMLLGDHLRVRPKCSIPVTLGLIPINDISDMVGPLIEPTLFYMSGMSGSGSCQFGRALLSLHSDLINRLADSKPLVIVFLAGGPDDAWKKPCKQIQDLALNSRINIIVIGGGLTSDLDALKQLGAAQPLYISTFSQANVQQIFEWLYDVIDTILNGLESGASGKLNTPNPPICLRVLP